MKRKLSLILCILLVGIVVNSCGKTYDPVDVTVGALKGPTAMGMVKFMDGSDNGDIEDNNYDFEVYPSIDEITTKLIKGEVDIAALPANLASVLYNNTDSIEVLAINTLGVLYICETGENIKSVEDLKGRTIYASGKGATPEYALRYILEKNEIDPEEDVNIEWKSEHSEVVASIVKDSEAVAMLPEPFVTTAQTKNNKIKSSLDLTKEWDAIGEKEDEDGTMITGVVVARKDFIKEHPEAVNAFLKNYEESVKYVNKNNKEAASLIGKYDIFPEAIALKALPNCNIVYIDGNEMKEKLSGYLSALAKQNKKAIGGKLPGDDFYYEK